MTMEYNKAKVIQVGNRFFNSYKKNRICTAWCLAGAKLFGIYDDQEINKAVDVLKQKGYPVAIKTIEL